MNNYIYFFSFILLLVSCNTENSKNNSDYLNTDLEAREDSLELAAAYAAQAKIELKLIAAIETEAVAADNIDDAADDPAIWYNKSNPESSIIYGSNKKGGLVAFDLEGRQTQYYPIGKINNVDVKQDVVIGSDTLDILGCTNRSDQSVELFSILKNGEVSNLMGEKFKVDTTKIDDVYGFCLAYPVANKRLYVIINGKNGYFKQFELKSREGSYELDLIYEMQFDSQTEGMVSHDRSNSLYVGEENLGVWCLSLNKDEYSEIQFIKESSVLTNKSIVSDVEGLSIYDKGDKTLLFLSSQGNFSYAVFDMNKSHNYLFSFKIIGSDNIDGVEETDGIEISSHNFSPRFNSGLFVAQDGFNYTNNSLDAQNFKFLNMDDILNLYYK